MMIPLNLEVKKDFGHARLMESGLRLCKMLSEVEVEL